MAALHTASALFFLPLKSYHNPDGEYSESELYKVMADLIAFIFYEVEPAKGWALRRDAKRGVEKLGKVMEKEIAKLNPTVGVLGRIIGGGGPSNKAQPASLKDYGANLAKRMLARGKSVEYVSWILLWSGFALVANTSAGVGFNPNPRETYRKHLLTLLQTVRSTHRLLPPRRK
jgi:hypothetical protein